MSSRDPLNSPATPDRPKNPTHFGGDGLYESGAESSDVSPPRNELRSADAFWDFARRNHVPALLAVGGLVCLLVALVRRSTERW